MIINIADPPYAIQSGPAVADTAFQAALNAAAGGKVVIPAGTYNVANISVPESTRIEGESKQSTSLYTGGRDQPLLIFNNNGGGLSQISLYGKGQLDTGTFGATQNTLTISGVGNVFENLRVWGGNSTMFLGPDTDDNYFEFVSSNQAYGGAQVTSQGSNWFQRCGFNFSSAPINPNGSPPWSAMWNPGTTYSPGDVVISTFNSNYYMICTVGGLSGGTAPALQNYSLNIVDGTHGLTWLLFGPVNYDAFLFGDYSGENHFEMCDFSTVPWANSVHINVSVGPPLPPSPRGATVSQIRFHHCVFAGALRLEHGLDTMVEGCEIGNTVNLVAGYTGRYRHIGNYHLGDTNHVAVGAGVSNFIFASNDFNGSHLAIGNGCTKFAISGNNNIGGSGITTGSGCTNYTVTGNIANTIAIGGTNNDYVVAHNNATVTGGSTSATQVSTPNAGSGSRGVGT